MNENWLYKTNFIKIAQLLFTTNTWVHYSDKERKIQRNKERKKERKKKRNKHTNKETNKETKKKKEKQEFRFKVSRQNKKY